jgi:presqualene diphosphate synthase
MMEVYRRNLERMQALTDAALADRTVSKRLVGRTEKLRIALRYGFV